MNVKEIDLLFSGVPGGSVDLRLIESCLEKNESAFLGKTLTLRRNCEQVSFLATNMENNNNQKQ